jgi:hypothetical protein
MLQFVAEHLPSLVFPASIGIRQRDFIALLRRRECLQVSTYMRSTGMRYQPDFDFAGHQLRLQLQLPCRHDYNGFSILMHFHRSLSPKVTRNRHHQPKLRSESVWNLPSIKVK